MQPYKKDQIETLDLSADAASAVWRLLGWNRLGVFIRNTTAATGYFVFEGLYNNSLTVPPGNILTPPAGSVHVDALPNTVAGTAALSGSQIVLTGFAGGIFVCFAELPPFVRLRYKSTSGGGNDCAVRPYLAGATNS